MPPISNSLGNISAPGTGAPIGGSAGPIGGTPIGGGSLGGTPIGGAAGPIGGGIGAIGGGAGAVGAGAIGSTGGSAGGMKPGPMGMPAMMQGLQNNPAPNPAAVGVSKYSVLSLLSVGLSVTQFVLGSHCQVSNMKSYSGLQ